MFYIYCESLLWIIKFLSAQAEWMHIAECPLVSTVSALAARTWLRMSAFCCVSCKINHCNYKTWAVTGFTRNMSMCPWMFNKRAALALRCGREGEKSSWEGAAAPGEGREGAQGCWAPFACSGFAGTAPSPSEEEVTPWWPIRRPAQFAPRTMLPGDGPCCKLSCLGTTLPPFTRE